MLLTGFIRLSNKRVEIMGSYRARNKMGRWMKYERSAGMRNEPGHPPWAGVWFILEEDLGKQVTDSPLIFSHAASSFLR